MTSERRRRHRRPKAEGEGPPPSKPPPPRHPDVQRFELEQTAQASYTDETLKRANEVKRKQFQLRAKLREQSFDDIAMLEGNLGGELQAIADNTKLRRMLPWLYGIGPSRVQQLMEIMYLNGHVKLGQLPYERRLHLARFVLTMRAGRYVHAPVSSPQSPPPPPEEQSDHDPSADDDTAA